MKATRLAKIKELITSAKLVIDVGSDHGLLAVDLIKEGRAAHVVNIDKRTGPLASGIANAEKTGLSDRIDHVLSDGFTSYKGPMEADVVVMAGFGGKEMVRVLAKMPVKWKRLIIQPSANAEKVRAFFKEKKWNVVHEHVLSDNKRFYELMVAAQGQGMTVQTEEDVLFGPFNRKNKDVAFVALWTERLSRSESNYANSKKDRHKRLINMIERELEEAVVLDKQKRKLS